MSTFKQMGFLSTDIDAEIGHFDNTFATWKEFYYKVNAYAMAEFLRPKTERIDKRSLLIYSCFYRMLTTYQAILLITQCANGTASKALLRVLVELLFVLKACETEESFSTLHIRLDTKRRIEFTKKALDRHKALKAKKQLSPFSKEDVSKMNREIANYVRESKDLNSNVYLTEDEKKWSIAQTAERAGLEDVYNSEYSYLCRYTHPSPTGMGNYLEIDSNRNITGFKLGPMHEDAEHIMRTAILTMIDGMGTFARYFKLPIEAEMQQFRDKLNELINHP